VIALVLAAQTVRGQTPIPGTYAISVCKTAPCTPGDSSHAVAWGQLVLFADSINLRALPDSARRLLEGLFLDRPANGCVIMQRASNATTYAGGVRGTYWSSDSSRGGWINLTLYRSPDAHHAVTARVIGTALRGTGRSAGAGAAEVDWPTDTIVGERIGPPDLAACVTATRSEWRRIQLFMDSLRSRSRPPT
jgi:hypothetical protein